MDIIYNLLLVTVMGLIAVIAGMFEDLESDVASTSNPNSQVQLAPQVGNLHKLFNRAVSGEPLLVGTMATVAATVCYCLLSAETSLIPALLLSTLAATIIQVIISVTSYMGRITSQALYNQPLFMDMLVKHLPTMAAHTFINLFSILLLSYIMVYMLNPPIALTLPVTAAFIGVTLGSVGSAVGDIHYGAEKLYQSFEFGAGISVSNNGSITTSSPLGSRNSIDVVEFCSKFAGPLTGLCFGIIIFLSFWVNMVFGIVYGLMITVILIIAIVILNMLLEHKSRKMYGKYEK